VFGGEVTKLGGTCAPYALYNWRVPFIWVYFYLFNEQTLPDISRVTHSPRECNWRQCCPTTNSHYNDVLSLTVYRSLPHVGAHRFTPRVASPG